MSRLRATADKKKVIKPSIDDQIMKPSTKLSKRDIDSSSHRLSKSTKRYSPGIKETGFSESYYQSNPDAVVDMREPSEKLEEMNETIASMDPESPELLDLLIKKKAASYLVYGESSRESILAHYDLGVLYDRQGRPQTGIRHLTKARQLEETTEIQPEESLHLALEYTNANYDLYNQKISSKDKSKQNEASKHLKSADDAIRQSYSIRTEDLEAIFRRDLLRARISMKKQKYADSADQFDTAIQSYIQLHEGKQDPELASLQVETGNAYAHAEKDSAPYYRKAYDIYISHSMNEEAEAIEPFLSEEINTDKIELNESKIADVSNKLADTSYAGYEEDSDEFSK